MGDKVDLIKVKLFLMFVFFRLFFGLFSTVSSIWGSYFLLFGLLSLIVGTWGLLFQMDLRKFLAFSTINHFGNFFLAFGCSAFL